MIWPPTNRLDFYYFYMHPECCMYMYDILLTKYILACINPNVSWNIISNNFTSSEIVKNVL